MVSVFRVQVALFVVAGLLALAPAHAATFWELSPVADPRVAIGTYTVVGGKTSPDGVNFTLKNNSLDNPVALTLVSNTPGATLHLSAFKDEGAFLDRDTDPNGTLVVHFRTGDDTNFKVTGPAGSAYQMSVWRGPAIKLPESDAIVAMDAAEAGGISPPQNAAAAMPANSPAPDRSNTLVYVLLGGIFAVLVVIAGLMYRGQQMRGKP